MPTGYLDPELPNFSCSILDRVLHTHLMIFLEGMISGRYLRGPFDAVETTVGMGGFRSPMLYHRVSPASRLRWVAFCMSATYLFTYSTPTFIPTPNCIFSHVAYA